MIVRRKPVRQINRKIALRRTNKIHFDKIRDEIDELSNIAFLLKEELDKKENTILNFQPVVKSAELH
ncbi:hypothetical protein OAO01_04965 [Oligoflexia bacterium]|nr:hypothetical protein [Oligoflexia bacterium]